MPPLGPIQEGAQPTVMPTIPEEIPDERPAHRRKLNTGEAEQQRADDYEPTTPANSQ